MLFKVFYTKFLVIENFLTKFYCHRKILKRNFVVTDIFLYKAFIIASFQKNNLLLSKFMVIKSILYKIFCYRKFSIHNFLLLKVFAL